MLAWHFAWFWADLGGSFCLRFERILADSSWSLRIQADRCRSIDLFSFLITWSEMGKQNVQDGGFSSWAPICADQFARVFGESLRIQASSFPRFTVTCRVGLVTDRMFRISRLVRRPVLLVRRVRLSHWLRLNRPSPEFLATVVHAVKLAFPADQAPVLQANPPWSSSLPACAVNSSEISRSLDVSGLWTRKLRHCWPRVLVFPHSRPWHSYLRLHQMIWWRNLEDWEEKF